MEKEDYWEFALALLSRTCTRIRTVEFTIVRTYILEQLASSSSSAAPVLF